MLQSSCRNHGFRSRTVVLHRFVIKRTHTSHWLLASHFHLIFIHSCTFWMSICVAIFLYSICHSTFFKNMILLHCYFYRLRRPTQIYIDELAINQNRVIAFLTINTWQMYGNAIYSVQCTLIVIARFYGVDKIEGLRCWFNKMNKWLNMSYIIGPLCRTNDCNCAYNQLDIWLNGWMLHHFTKMLSLSIFVVMKFFSFKFKVLKETMKNSNVLHSIPCLFWVNDQRMSFTWHDCMVLAF